MSGADGILGQGAAWASRGGRLETVLNGQMLWYEAPVTGDGETSRDRWWGSEELPRRGKQRPGCAHVPFLVSSKRSVLQALTFIIFICFTASISAYMAAALLEFFITLAFLFLYATQYYQRFGRLNWPCLVRDPAVPTPL